MARKTSKGRQRVEMVKMKNESNLQVTFSKRRFGLFKKANELVTLCGAEVALIVFSPGQKVFSFGQPSVDALIERFLNRQLPSGGHNNADRLIEAHRVVTVRQLSEDLNHAEEMLENEKKYSDSILQRILKSPIKNWWDTPLENYTQEQLLSFKAAIETLKRDVEQAASNLVQNANNPYIVDSGMLARNFAPYGGFNRVLPFAVPREGEAIMTAMAPRPLMAPGANMNIPPMAHGFDQMSYARRFV